MKKLLYSLRHLIILPVIGSAIMAISASVMGIGRIYTGLIYLFSEFDFSAKTAKAVSIAIIEVIDLFLIATVCYITAVGLYKLFINIDFQLPGLIKIASLNDLESKIIGVTAAVLAVTFLGEAGAAAGGGPEEKVDVFYFGGGIALVISSLAFLLKVIEKKNGKEDDSSR